MSNIAIKNQKLISLRVPSTLADYIDSKAKSEGRSTSNYIRWILTQTMDETEYLMSSENNKNRLLNAIKNKSSVKTFNEIEINNLITE